MSTADLIWLNGEFVAWEDAKVHVLTHALHYGSAVFEGIRCYDTVDGPAVFRLPEHVQRLIESARVYRQKIGQDLTPIAAEPVQASGHTMPTTGTSENED